MGEILVGNGPLSEMAGNRWGCGFGPVDGPSSPPPRYEKACKANEFLDQQQQQLKLAKFETGFAFHPSIGATEKSTLHNTKNLLLCNVMLINENTRNVERHQVEKCYVRSCRLLSTLDVTFVLYFKMDIASLIVMTSLSDR
jgi:hypothetical protein